MTLTRLITITKNAAQQRLELEHLLKQPVPDAEHLERSLPLLNALNETSPYRWQLDHFRRDPGFKRHGAGRRAAQHSLDS
ncbi:MAG: hypothetical protein VX069_06505 [Cyanobacteriota bacterium]|nr:hypothetical protein [Cyanobacteriota bacterium]